MSTVIEESVNKLYEKLNIEQELREEKNLRETKMFGIISDNMERRWDSSFFSSIKTSRY